MKVGDYVRTKNGEIGKLVNIEVYYVLGQDDKDKYSCVLFNNSYIPCVVLNDFIVKKGQLIDLIEVGDYVNGRKVVDKQYHYTDKDNYDMGKWCIFYENVALGDYQYDIKSIVTKEQFESMKYKVGE